MRQSKQLYEQLAFAGNALDALTREVSCDIASQARYDALEAEAQRIALAIVVAFRGPATGPVQTLTGRAAR